MADAVIKSQISLDAAFVVLDGESGHIYEIYTDGRITGFPASASLVFNRIHFSERAHSIKDQTHAQP